MKSQNKIFLALLLIPTISILNGCGGNKEESPTKGGSPTVVSAAASTAETLGPVVLKNESTADYCPQAENDGDSCAMYQENAQAYCESIGSRLPTIREFAEYAAKNGAAGIRSSAFSGTSGYNDDIRAEIQSMGSEGYQRVIHRDEAGEDVIDFYLNLNGYRENEDQLGNHQFWTSSAHDAASFYVFNDLDSGRNDIQSEEGVEIRDVRCISK